jgi:CHASE2 domain-containing sensor protein
MSSGPEQSTRGNQSSWSTRRQKLVRNLKVSFAIERDRDSHRIRTVTLGWLFGLAFAVLGIVYHVPGAGLFGESPFELDRALKTVSLGWFESRRTLPVTLVDIDAATHAAWHSPIITPRAEVARMIDVVTSADPLAVVVDIDLSGNAGDAEKDTSGTLELRRFLESYRGNAPLLFPRRLEPDADGRWWETQSPFDDVFAANARLRWAHASFAMDRGAVRAWAPWIEVCTRPIDEPGTADRDIAVAHTQWLAAIPVQLVRSRAVKLAYDDAPPLSGDCRGEAGVAPQRLLVGPRLTGGAVDASSSARTVSAGVLLEEGIQLETSQLFTKRIVLIGATHPASGDFWVTTSGVIPGVELIANSVRYAPLQQETSRGSALWRRAGALVFFVYFAVITWQMRGVPMLFTVLVVTLLLVVLAIGVFDRYDVFEALESAILLTILYKAAVEILTLFEEGCIHWRASAGRRCRLCRTLWAISSRHPPPVEETHA